MIATPYARSFFRETRDNEPKSTPNATTLELTIGAAANAQVLSRDGVGSEAESRFLRRMMNPPRRRTPIGGANQGRSTRASQYPERKTPAASPTPTHVAMSRRPRH